MFNRETRSGLAPKSWLTVFVWFVLAAVVISRPTDSISFFFGAIQGTGEWLGYTAFADCGTEPPMDWIETKPCPDPIGPGDADQGPGSEAPLVPSEDATANGDPSEYVIEIDDQAIRSVLDQGAEIVVDLHDEVTDVQDAGGFSVEVGSGP